MLRARQMMAMGELDGGASDTIAPTCIITCTQTSPTAAATLNFTITFSEVATGFEVGDFAITNGTKGALGGSGAVYTCDVTPTTAATPVTANVAAGVCTDLAGNPNTAATQVSIEYYSAIYYARKTGNDTTGDGSTGAPWLTLKKAMTIVGAGHLLRVGDGTYSEAEGAGANGYWKVAKNLANWLVIEPELGALGSVIVTGTTGTNINIYFPAGQTISHVKLRYLTLSPVAGTFTIVNIGGANVSNVIFDHCSILAGAVNAAGLVIASVVVADITFDHCTITTVAGDAVTLTTSTSIDRILFDTCTITSATGKGIVGTSTGGTGDYTFSSCTINGGSQAAAINGGVPNILTCALSSVANGTTVLFGVDGTSGNATTPTITNCTITHDPTKTGHSLLFGAGCVNAHADNVTIPASYDNGIVVKECTGAEVENCHVTGGNTSGLYFKAATTPNAHHNVITAAAGKGFQVLKGDTGNKCSTWQFQNNTVNVSGTGKALTIGTSALDDAGGGICDYNQYQNNSGLGVVRGDSNVANLTELQAAWADYDVTTNDSHSTVV